MKSKMSATLTSRSVEAWGDGTAVSSLLFYFAVKSIATALSFFKISPLSSVAPYFWHCAARAHTTNSSAVTAFIKRIVFVILSKKIGGGGNGARSPELPIRRQNTGDTA